MTQSQEERMNWLCEEIEKHRHYYYNLNDPIISDKEFDKLFDELVDLEKKTGVVFDYSPTKRAGILPISNFKKVEHIFRMYSLDKAQSFDELNDFFERTEKTANCKLKYVLEYKFDGISLDITYKNGKYVQALTRGNGIIGEDVTEQVRTIRTVPMIINYKNTVCIQGEAVMRKSELVKYNKHATEALKNERNGVSGAIRNLDPKITASRNLDFIAYSINKIEGKKFNTQTDVHNFLKDNNFYVSDYFKLCTSSNEIRKHIEEANKVKKNLDILIDGMVIKVDNLEVREELGFTDRFPRGQIAYKFEPEEITTKLMDVIWQVGRTGKLTPIAILEPVDIAGVTVKRATLNNIGDIRKKKIKLNDRIIVRRSNEVIPEVMGVAETYPNSIEIQEPSRCPSCKNALVGIGANLFCLNHNGCKEQIVNKLTHFVSRGGMNIDGLSENTLEALREKYEIINFADLYKLTRQNLEMLNGFKDKKITKMLNSIEKSKNVELSNFIYAIGIDGVGKKMAKELANKFKSYDNLKKATFDELINMPDIAEITATDILNFFKDEDMIQDINELFNLGVKINKKDDKFVDKESFFSGQKVVLTGSLVNFTRNEAGERIEKLGGETQSSVTNTTTLVIAGENAGSKLEKAKEKNIKIIDEAEFLKILENENQN